MVGIEALMRWQHPELGPISPGEFIPLAEESGDMIRLGRWALLTACHDAMRWAWTGRVAVNVSPSQLQNTDLVADIEHALGESGLNPARLEIELTEGTVLRDVEAAQALAAALRERGIGLALDDFGTGYSALSHLSTLPFDTIKIDQSFVRRMDQTATDRSLLESIIAMGKALDKTVLAEGIETVAQLDALRLAGCDIGQGYHLGRPMETSAIAALLSAGSARSA
jgi:EAL domain-containing protein (putative c-di-GMP-specific phosphodiesterase class I)